ncbi:histidine kinase [Algoriphagus namhaensis]
MDPKFLESFGGWYMVSIDLLMIMGIILFLSLPKKKRSEQFYYLPILILVFTVFYENLGAYTIYDKDFNAHMNAFFGNTENPGYNLWVFNIFNRLVGTVLYLILIRCWVTPSKKIILTWMIWIFIACSLLVWIMGIEPIYLNQPITFALGANFILIGCGLYFLGLISDDGYLNSNPLKMISFWQMTFLLFTYSLTYINSVSLTYLYSVNPQLGMTLIKIDWVMSLTNLAIFILIVASPKLPRLFETEPYYGN